MLSANYRPGSGLSGRNLGDLRPRRQISLELRSASRASGISDASSDGFTGFSPSNILYAGLHRGCFLTQSYHSLSQVVHVVTCVV